MTTNRRAYLAVGLMIMGMAGAKALTPKLRRSDVLGPLDLENAIPKTFGEWRMDTTAPQMIVDPQTQATINATYTATLSRVYVNQRSERIMLSIAYGAELSDTGIGLHYPEVCYPAQGFKVQSSTQVTLNFSQGSVRARNLETTYADYRFEPVTYWTMIGPRSEYAGLARKITEIELGLSGQRADGLLFRVSNITKNTSNGFSLNRAFTNTLLDALDPASRKRISGL